MKQFPSNPVHLSPFMVTIALRLRQQRARKQLLRSSTHGALETDRDRRPEKTTEF